jgi:PleD family two-component response regulator
MYRFVAELAFDTDYDKYSFFFCEMIQRDMAEQVPIPHILLVDDHLEIRDAVTQYLEKNGLRVTSAKTYA